MNNYSFKTKQSTNILDNINTVILRGNATALVPKSKCFILERSKIEKGADYKQIACKAKDFVDLNSLVLTADNYDNKIRGTFIHKGKKLNLIFITEEVISIGTCGW